MTYVKILDDSKIKNFVNEEELVEWSEKVKEVHKKIHEKTGEGSDFLGWVDLPINYNKEEFERIKNSSGKN